MSKTEIAIDRESTLRRGLVRLEEQAPMLAAMAPERVESAIVSAARMLADPERALGRQAREALPPRAELSPEMFDWALQTTLETVTHETLRACRDALARDLHPHRSVPARLHAVVLSSNLCTASIKPIVWSLLVGAPVALKLAASDDGLTELFALALTLADEELGQCVMPTRFSRADEPLTKSLFAAADAISIYGGDHTVHTLSEWVPAGAERIAHGHGLGAAFVAREDADLEAFATGLALDVAAYDQRGCLSPQVVFVEGSDRGRSFASLLADALSPLATSLPRAQLSVPHATRQVQWRRVGEALGELFEGDGYAVAFDARGPLRACPLARNIAVHTVADRSELSERLMHFGVHLKCLAAQSEVGPLPPPLCPRLSAPGFMQRPTLLDLHDGRLPWHGLRRRVG